MNMSRRTISLRAVLGAVLLAAAGVASATAVTVGAEANSLGGGAAALSGVDLTAGESFSVSVDPSQLWNFSWGRDGYWTDANGAPGWNYDLVNPDGTLLNSHIGELVGRIGNGDYFNVGTSFTGVANATGQLTFWYVDSDAFNNVGSVVANVSAVPEPASTAMLLAGLGAMALAARRRRDAR